MLGQQALWGQSQMNQYTWDCEPALYQIVDNQLHELSVNASGMLFWVAVLPKFERSIGALAYSKEDGYLYALDTKNYQLLRINRHGVVQALGVPQHALTQKPLAIALNIGTFVDERIFVAYSHDERLYYWIDIKTGMYRTSEISFKGMFMNLAYHEESGSLYTFSDQGILYKIDPVSKRMRLERKIDGLPVGRSAAFGSLWITKDQRFWVTRKEGTAFYEINRSTFIAYSTKTPLLKALGDGTSCGSALPPSFIEHDLLKWDLEAPNKDRMKGNWISVHEEDNAAYEVEYSTDHQTWKKVDEKPSIGSRVYQNPYGSLMPYNKRLPSYYRLKKIYTMGNVTYSRTVASNLPKIDQIALLSPQLALDRELLNLYLQGYNNSEVLLIIKNEQGAIVTSNSRYIYASSYTLSVPVGHYTSGWYSLQIVGDKTVKNLNFWVQ